MPSNKNVVHAYVAHTTIGPLAFFWTAVGLKRIAFPTYTENNAPIKQADVELKQSIEANHGVVQLSPDLQARHWIHSVYEHLRGSTIDLTQIPIDWSGIPTFSKKVYLHSRLIPNGTTVSYQQLANAMETKAFRAVGSALGRNPIPIVIPCHRIVSKNGPGGFSAPGGLSTKALLLAIEGGSLDDAQHSLARRHLIQNDSRLAPWVRSIDCTLPISAKVESGTILRALVRSILGQQLSVQASATIFSRVETALCLPTSVWDLSIAQKIQKIPISKLRALGVSQSKAHTILELASAVHSGSLSLEQLPYMLDTSIIEQLTQIKGIGRWTAEMLLIFTLGRPDIFPVLDLGLRKAFQKLYRLKTMPTFDWMVQHAEAWRPWRSIGTWYAWKSLDI